MSIGRPRNPAAQYRIYRHIVGKYVYAATQGYVIDETTGESRRRVLHWGRVTENNKFIPNDAYMMLSPEERRKLIFPDDWDLTEITKLPSQRGPGRPAYESEAQDRLYGAVWLMEQVADKLGVTKDLLTVFDGNQEKVRDILTLAMYLYTTGEPFSHVAEWQDLEWYPSLRRLTPSTITRLLKTITNADRVQFTDLRRARLDKEAVCAVDSTTRGSRGKSLPDVAVGKRKEGGYGSQTTEVVVYSLSTHEPVYYQTFPGNVPDSKTLPTILKDLHQAGYKDLILVTDRGYECQRNIELCILRKQKLLTAANVERNRIRSKIRELDDVSGCPSGMEWFAEEGVFCKQYKLDVQIKGRGGKPVQSDRFLLNLYFDPVQRARELVDLQNTLAAQEECILRCQKERTPVANSDCRLYNYYHLTRDSSGLIESYELREEKVLRKQETFGFFANLTLGVNFTAQQALTTYCLRDEQEKYFFSMKTRIDCDLQRNWSEKARRGARFIEFVALILISWIKHIWSITEQLRSTFGYVRSMILIMRQIHRIERPGKDKVISPFLKKQMLICEQFGVNVPADWSADYSSLEIKPPRKRGRPRTKQHPGDKQ